MQDELSMYLEDLGTVIYMLRMGLVSWCILMALSIIIG